MGLVAAAELLSGLLPVPFLCRDHSPDQSIDGVLGGSRDPCIRADDRLGGGIGAVLHCTRLRARHPGMAANAARVCGRAGPRLATAAFASSPESDPGLSPSPP